MHCVHNDDAEEEENKKQEREGCQRGGGAVACKSAYVEAHADLHRYSSGCYSPQNWSRFTAGFQIAA
jgi:hypothetical protein